MTQLSRNGVSVDARATLDDVLRLFQHAMSPVEVKAEPAAEGDEEEPEGVQQPVVPSSTTSQQHHVIRALARGSRMYDPAQNPRAVRDWSHLIQAVDVKELRHTHDRISRCFKHGPHAGQRVQDLTAQLENVPRNQISRSGNPSLRPAYFVLYMYG